MTFTLLAETWGVQEVVLYLDDETSTLGALMPDVMTVVFDGEGPVGRTGGLGPKGDKGDPGDTNLTDPGDLTLLFDNRLI